MNHIDIDEPAIRNAIQILDTSRSFFHKCVTAQKMQLALQGIYVDNRFMYFTLLIKNNSMISYLPSYIRFFVKDRRQSKRAAVQEHEILPVYSNAEGSVKGNEERRVILAFPAFTILPSQQLLIQVGEQNGARILSFPVKYRTILKARQLPK